MPSRNLSDYERRERNARYARERRYRKARHIVGQYDRVPVVRAREAVLRALLADVPVSLIATCSGVEERAIERLFRPERAFIQARTEARLMSGARTARRMMQTGRASPKRVHVEPYREMVRRLGAAGWPLDELLAEWGLPENIARDRAVYITPQQATQVRKMYESIGYTLGPSLYTARIWRKRGYLLPAAECAEDMLPLPPTAEEQRRRARRRKHERRLERARRERARIAKRRLAEAAAVGSASTLCDTLDP